MSTISASANSSRDDIHPRHPVLFVFSSGFIFNTTCVYPRSRFVFFFKKKDTAAAGCSSRISSYSTLRLEEGDWTGMRCLVFGVGVGGALFWDCMGSFLCNAGFFVTRAFGKIGG